MDRPTDRLTSWRLQVANDQNCTIATLSRHSFCVVRRHYGYLIRSCENCAKIERSCIDRAQQTKEKLNIKVARCLGAVNITTKTPKILPWSLWQDRHHFDILVEKVKGFWPSKIRLNTRRRFTALDSNCFGWSPNYQTPASWFNWFVWPLLATILDKFIANASI